MLFKGLIIFNESRVHVLGSESNRIEVSPFYDTIIYSDIADIINEFGNNGVSIKVSLFCSLFSQDTRCKCIYNVFRFHRLICLRAYRTARVKVTKS